MTDMREYAAQHGWEVGSHLRYAGSTQPPSVITYISATEIRISTPGDFPGRLTGGSSSALGKWTLDWQYRAEQAEAAIARVRGIVDADQTVPIDARDPASYVAGYADATFRVRQVLDGQR